MPIIKSAIKRMRQTVKRRERNVTLKRDIKGAVKAFTNAPSSTSLSAAHSEIDTAVKKGLLKKATAARRKAALSKTAKSAGVTLAAKKKSPAVTAKKAAPAKKAVAKKTATTKASPKKPAPKKPATKK
jgi:ribosomal protein S20